MQNLTSKITSPEVQTGSNEVDPQMEAYIEQVKAFNERTGERQEKAMRSFIEAGRNMINDINKVIEEFDKEEGQGESVHFYREIGDVLHEMLYKFNPYYYPSVEEYKDLKGHLDEMRHKLFMKNKSSKTSV